RRILLLFALVVIEIVIRTESEVLQKVRLAIDISADPVPRQLILVVIEEIGRRISRVGVLGYAENAICLGYHRRIIVIGLFDNVLRKRRVVLDITADIDILTDLKDLADPIFIGKMQSQIV